MNELEQRIKDLAELLCCRSAERHSMQISQGVSCIECEAIRGHLREFALTAQDEALEKLKELPDRWQSTDWLEDALHDERATEDICAAELTAMLRAMKGEGR